MTDFLQEIENWQKAGCKEKDGIRLFLNLQEKTPLGKLVKLCPEQNGKLAVKQLFAIAGKKDNLILNRHWQPLPATAQSTDAPKFREMFPFLNEKNTPNELKVLAADKITAYRKSITAHARLVDCTTLEQCYITAKEVVENYLENYEITQEFKHYMDTGRVLGKHAIFSEMKKLAELRKSKPSEILKRQKQVENNIFQIKSQLKKGDKSHLRTQREKRLRELMHVLQEINRIIDGL
ncbi:MAG: hypothetical protein LBS50_06940 [Prevotellaceae bacterium]|jgi:hypothetical protein|nr:hypothetical protein [Prevotellaceae bacterium]